MFAAGRVHTRHSAAPRMDQKQLFQQMSRKSLPYQVIKYILLVLNIMIVTTTAVVTIIIFLLPTIILEKKLAVENALTYLETGNILPHGHLNRKDDFVASEEQQEKEQAQLWAQEVYSMRVIRFVILGLSACIILNQTLAVYGLFRERTCHILSSSTFIGLVGQLSLFVLPASVFILVILYLTFSIAYVILLGHLNTLAKQPPPRSVSRASSVEPQNCSGKTCCCRCKGCLCNPGPVNVPFTATINPTRKNSMPSQSQSQYQSVPYYYGSLGRKSRETKVYLNQLQAMKPDPIAEMYTQRTGPRMNATGATLRPANKFGTFSMDNYKNAYGNPRRESAGYNYVNMERAKNSTMI